MEMHDYNKYKDFTEIDFIKDPYFQDWVINTNTENNAFWGTFFKTYSHKKEAGELAGNFLKKVAFEEDLPHENLIKRSLAKHLDDIERFENSKIIDLRKKLHLKKLLRIAAIFGGVVLIALALLFNKKDKPVLVKTDYGNLKSVVLPDSSLVVLNANSTIKFSNKWGKSKSREVWLQGEAFFNVRHINKDSSYIEKYEQFIVHTDELIVEVLGTSFDIRQRRGKTEVVLETGK
ncbi:MAG: FecR family protein, partial [Segetibacter sp.]